MSVVLLFIFLFLLLDYSYCTKQRQHNDSQYDPVSAEQWEPANYHRCSVHDRLQSCLHWT